MFSVNFLIDYIFFVMYFIIITDTKIHSYQSSYYEGVSCKGQGLGILDTYTTEHCLPETSILMSN